MTHRIMAIALMTGVLLILAPPAPSGPQAQHTCAVTSGGGVKCWGFNFAGALGDGTTTDRATPVNVVGLGSGVTQVTTGSLHTCAVVSGAAKCWGSNFAGKLGEGTTTNRLTPVDVSGLGSGTVQLSAAANHTCALTTAGAVKCWGLNGAGQLGDGRLPTSSPVPVNVVGLGSGVAQISAGFSHTCALTALGAVKCWGLNSAGQLGDGTTVNRSTPADVSGLAGGVVRISAGSNHTCALIAGGAVKCWGDNSSGALGDGTNTNRLAPVDVSGLAGGIRQIAAGDLHTCALTAGGSAKCWGNNGSFQLGIVTTNQNQLTPVDVPGLGSLSQISPAFRHTCALTSAGAAQCWGSNANGQLGDGTTGFARRTPMDVSGLSSGVALLPETGGLPVKATLTVITNVVNDNGGTLTAGDFTLSVTGTNASPASFPGQAAPGRQITLDAGDYEVDISSRAGYAITSFSPGCTGTISAGNSTACTITADDQRGTLTVITNVVNDNGGTLTAGDFTLSVTGTNPSPGSFPGQAAPGRQVTLDSGAYSVAASGPAGYRLTYSADCAGTIAAGEIRTCTITADDQPATLFVITNVVNDNGGTLVPGLFIIDVSASTRPNPHNFGGQGPPGQMVTLDAGSYLVSSNSPLDYQITYSPDCAATIAPGETKTCTITADDPADAKAPAVTITSPAQGAIYTKDEVVDAAYSCRDEPGGSGLASCSGPVLNGYAIDTATIGPHSFLVTGTDNAGNSAAVTHAYSVVYCFKGFFSPVDRLPVLNSVGAGQAIPVRFSLCGDQGSSIFATGYPKTQQVLCGSSAPVDGIEETVTAGASGLRYDAASDRYSYVWKTERSWANTCRELVLKLADGTVHVANFKFR